MKVLLAKQLPVRYAFEAAEGREDGWGRFLRLDPTGGRLLTPFRLEEGDRVYLSFEADRERFEQVPAKVQRSVRDEDGYWDAELRLLDRVVERRLGDVLRGFVARAGAS